MTIKYTTQEIEDSIKLLKQGKSLAEVASKIGKKQSNFINAFGELRR